MPLEKGMSRSTQQALITATLEFVSGNKVKAAQVLDINLKTLHNRLHAYNDAPGGPSRSRRRQARRWRHDAAASVTSTASFSMV